MALDAEKYLSIHSFQNKKKKLHFDSLAVSNLSLQWIAKISGSSTSKSVNSSLAKYQLDLVQSSEFWLDANDRGLKQNKEIMSDINRLAFSEAGITAAGRIGGPAGVAGTLGAVVIANVMIHAQHYANEKLINFYFD